VSAAAAADLVGLVGRVLLVAGAAVVVVAALAVVPRIVRVRHRALALRATVEAMRVDTLTALALLSAQQAETQELLVPWRTLLRWARHPLVVAALQWYRRRRAAERRTHA
jgi:hypothetical protein